jgi:tetratricopeptide (TPR) repeat protein
LGLWLSDALVEAKKPDEALTELDRLKTQNYLLGLDPNIMLRTGAIEYNRGNFEKAKDSYEDLVATEPSARSHLYLGDALLSLDQIKAARYHYRQALLIQPDLVDALRGYWWKVPPDEQAKEDVFDKLFWFVNKRLRRLAMGPRLRVLYWLVKQHYRLHPEDSRVHFMLGAHALLLKKLDVASERLEFANELVGGLDVQATARLVIVRLLEARKDNAEKELIKLRTTELGHPPTPQELVDRGVDLYKPVFERPGKPLLSTEESQWLAEKVVAIFPNLEGVTPSVPLGS